MQAVEVINRERSCLKVAYLDFPRILECIQDIDSLLIERPRIIVRDKECRQNRNVGFFSDEVTQFNYSMTKTPANKLPPSMLELLQYVNDYWGRSYNAVLVNKYVDGNDSIGAHSDDLRMADKSQGVAIVSFGAPRKFRVKDIKTKQKVLDLITERSSAGLHMLLMDGAFQSEFTHEIPQRLGHETALGKELKVKDVRYSFTFRKHYNDSQS